MNNKRRLEIARKNNQKQEYIEALIWLIKQENI